MARGAYALTQPTEWRPTGTWQREFRLTLKPKNDITKPNISSDHRERNLVIDTTCDGADHFLNASLPTRAERTIVNSRFIEVDFQMQISGLDDKKGEDSTCAVRKQGCSWQFKIEGAINITAYTERDWTIQNDRVVGNYSAGHGTLPE
jgi:hypothetical protein